MPLQELISQIRENNPPIVTLKVDGRQIDNANLQMLSAELKTNNTVTSVDLSYNDFGSEGIRSFSDTLKTNQTLTKANLSHNKIGPDGAKYLSEALKTNITLLSLDVSHSNIYLALGVLGIQYLCELIKANHGLARINLSYSDIQPPSTKTLSEALKANYGLTSIVLTGNKLGPVGTQDICEALKINDALSAIDLSSTEMGDAGIKAIAEMLELNKGLTDIKLGFNHPIGLEATEALSRALKINTTLTRISLKTNRVGPMGAHYLSQALQSNNSLIDIDFSDNEFGDTGVKHIAEMLKGNCALTAINLLFNEISDGGVKYLCDALKVNKTLKTIILAFNDIGDEGVTSLCKVLTVNNTLTCINLEGNKKIGPVGINALKETLKTNYTLQKLYGVNDDPTIKQYLERNKAIAASFTGFTEYLTEGLNPQDLQNNLSLLEELIQPNMPADHYLQECYRLLTALGHLTTVDSEIDALTHLLPPFTHPVLQKTADLALSLLLCTDLAQQLDQLTLQEKRCQLVLHGLNDALQRPELNNFAYIALFHLVYPNKPIIRSEFDSFKNSTALLNQAQLKRVIRDALIACQKNNSLQEEINFLKTCLAQQNYPPAVVTCLSQSPAFLVALRDQYPDATCFTLVEYTIFAQDNQSFLIPINQSPSVITPQTMNELETIIKQTSTYQADIKAQILTLKQTLNDMVEKKPTVQVMQSNLSFFTDNSSQPQTNSSPHESNLSEEQLQQIKKLISSLEKEISSFWPYPNKNRKQIKVDALNSFIGKTETMTISEAIDKIDIEYPQVRSGQISTRTADLFNSLRNANKITIT